MSLLARIEDFSDLDYNPFTALGSLGGENKIGDELYVELACLRRLGPVHEGDLRRHFGLQPDLTMAHLRHVAVLGHAEVEAVLSDARTYSNVVYNHNLGVFFGSSITTMDNPEHFNARRLFQKAFSPKMITQWEDEMIPRVINHLIDNFEAEGKAELVSQFTLHFPFHFIHELMALPIEDRGVFHKLAFGQIAIIFDTDHGMDAVNKLKAYLTAVIEARRADPVEDDFITTIAEAEINGERLPNDVVVSFFRQLMNAGGDTSYHGFSSVLAALLAHPEQLEAIKANRALIGPAIEEGLRWNCPVPIISRTPTREVELGGVAVRPGDHMAVCLAAANRDDAAFREPDRFDIFRDGLKHKAFGYGGHICIGQHLARLEMAAAMNALLDRAPKLRADPDFPPSPITGLSLRGPHSLHVRFD